MHLSSAPCRNIKAISWRFFYRVTFIIGPWCDRVPRFPMRTRGGSALCWLAEAPLYKVLRCLDTHAVQKKRSLPPEERTAFEGASGGKKSSQRFVALSHEFFYLVRDIGVADRSFQASLRNVLGTNCLQGAIGACSLSPYNAERSSLSSLSV